MTPLEAKLTKEIEALRLENKLLREKIDGLVRRLFGASSEKLNPGQLQLLLEGFEEKKPKPLATPPTPWRLTMRKRPRSSSAASASAS